MRSSQGERLIFIDAGAHAGVFSDVALASGGICYAFEPNIYLASFLKELYKDNENLIFYQNALSIENKKTKFYNPGGDMTSQGGGIVKIKDCPYKESDSYDVEMIDFCEFLTKILAKHDKITLIKMDIEGAEFEILEKLINLNLYEKVEYIMVETHERFFENPEEKISKLKNLIASKNITNIYLDWI